MSYVCLFHLLAESVVCRPSSVHSGIRAGRRVVEHLFEGRTLDKAAQRSAWAQRPLPAGQLQYAALDVAVLLQIHAEWGQTR